MELEYKKSIAQLKCGLESGTAFLVGAEKAVTARHTIDDHLDNGEQIFLCFPHLDQDKSIEAKVIFPDKPYVGQDIAILELTEPVEGLIPLNLSKSTIHQKEAWIAYGYSTTKRKTGEVFQGSVSQAYASCTEDGGYDLDLACIHPQIIDTKYITKGASGSPIFKDNKVVGVLSDKIPGGSIGGVSILSCSRVLEKESITLEGVGGFREVESFVELGIEKDAYNAISDSKGTSLVAETISSSVPLNIEKIKETIGYLIEDFPSDTHNRLREILDEVINEVSSMNPAKFSNYLHQYRFPFTLDHNDDIGLEHLIEILMLIKIKFPDTTFIFDDQTANLCVDEDLDLFTFLVYAVNRHTKMPEIILGMMRKILRTPTGRKTAKRGEPILPYPIILDNCSKHKKMNLCSNCQSEFSFENILKDFCAGEEEGYFVGVEKNNLGLLQETKILCANCVRDLHNEVANLDELLQQIREMIV
ncbi:hypothetical protein IEE_03928 [Bacillus cereus BAG5X1-1]|uniref:ABC-three component systems C-terminal domain-containing protein n=1 Tax=Bacillus cereus BAG5X1-1 TaxID=1053189 RepID=J7XDM4_BACCE|nr:ABC-three component system protein [Bacillus cereus]EJQ42363.1 hypothetical protein IEE_03928 [Bacillus cereus BAG5X1-1]